MKFPVDLLASVSQTELEHLAHNYMNNLLYSNPDSPEHLILSDSTQVTINISSVGFTPLYGSGDRQKVLALFSPSNPFTAVALFLLDRWWTVDDILKTADATRGGTVEVKSLGERIVLYILNRIVYRAKEMSSEELPFLCHGEKDYAKILWNNGEAVGFYSVKPAGSFCNSFSTSSYQLPVMDSIFIRKRLRRQGFGLQMLKDFVLSFREDCLGLRYPLTKFMYKVCEKYLCQYPGDTDILWEVKSIGGPKQRTNIFKKLRAMDQRTVSAGLSFAESLVITERTEKEVLEAVSTQIKDSVPVECTVEIVEEVTALSATKEAEVPLTACSSSGSKQRKNGEDKAEKAIRIEDIEADDISAQEKTELRVSNLMKADGTSTVACEEQGEHTLDQPSTVLSQRDLEEAGVTLAPTSEESQVEDDAPQNLNSNFCDSQITVENVASEIREKFQQEKETLEHVGEGTQVGVPDEKSEERVTQQEPTVSTRATSKNIVTGKTGRANVRAVIAVDHVTTTRRSTHHSKQEDVGTTLRRRSIRNTLPPTLKYPLHRQKVSEESEKEPSDVEELVEESAVAEREPQDEEETSIEEDAVAVKELSEETQQLEDEQPKSEEHMVKHQQPVVRDSQPPDTAETSLTKECQDEVVTPKTKKEPKGELQTSVIQNETQEPPAEASAGDKIAEEKEAYKQMAQEGTVQKAKEAAVDIIPLTAEHTVSEICENSEADISVEDSAEGNLPLAEVDEAVKLEEEESENCEQEPAATTRTLRLGRPATTHTAKGKSKQTRKQGEEESKCVQDMGEVEEEAAKEAAVEKTDEEMEEIRDRATVVASDKEEGLQLETHVEGGEAEVEHKQHGMEDERGLASDPPAEGDEVKAPEEDNIEVENEDAVQSIAVVTAAADDLAPEETGTPLPSPATHSAVLPSVKDGGTPSAEEQQSEEMPNQFSSLRKLTVVLMDLQKPNHGVQDVTEAKEGNLVQKTAAKAEGEMRERTKEDEDTVAQENVPMGVTTTTEKEALEDESTIVEVSKAEVGEPMTNQEEGERHEERDPTEVDKNIEAEEAVNQHHAQEEGPIDDEEKTMDVAEEAVAKRDTVKGETSTSTPEVVESVQQTMLTAKDRQVEDVCEEDAPVVERGLRSGGKTTRGKTTTKHDDAKVEKRTEEGEPAASIRVLRKGRKPADGATQPKSKRARTICQGEREEDDECALPDVAQEEETIALLEETDKKEESTDEKIEEKNANEDAPQDEGNAEPELCNVAEAVSGESLTDQETVGEKESAAEASFGERAEETLNIDEAKVNDAEEALTVKSGEEAVRAISRQGRRSAAAAPGHKAKRARSQCQQEEVGEEEAPPAVETLGEEKEAGQESPEDKAIEREEMVKDKNVEEEEYTMGDAGQTKDASTRKEDDSSVEAVSGSVNIPSPSDEDEETTVVEQQKASPRSKRQKDDSTRRSVRKRPKVNYQENEDGERAKGGTDEEEEVTVAFDGDHGNKTAQCSSETAKEAEAAGSSKEGEEEPVVIGKRVLRGRSVPSVTITPQSRSRRRSIKVSKENSPRSAHKRKGPR
ncbi:fam169a [Pungitius sinensis]